MVTLSNLREVETEIISILAENLHCNHEEVVMMETPVMEFPIMLSQVFLFFSSYVLANFPGNYLSIIDLSGISSGLWSLGTCGGASHDDSKIISLKQRRLFQEPIGVHNINFFFPTGHQMQNLIRRKKNNFVLFERKG